MVLPITPTFLMTRVFRVHVVLHTTHTLEMTHDISICFFYLPEIERHDVCSVYITNTLDMTCHTEMYTRPI